MYVWQACNKKLELDTPSRQQTRKTPTRERKRVRYLQISYQYHLSPRCRHDFPRGPVGRGLRRCCHGTSCKKKADYTRSMYLSQPDHQYYNSTARLMQVTQSPDEHTCFILYAFFWVILLASEFYMPTFRNAPPVRSPYLSAYED